MDKDKWWVVEGVRNPAYIGLRDESRRFYGYILLIIMSIVLSILVLEIVKILPPGMTFIAFTLMFFIEFLLKITGFSSRKISHTDKLFIHNLLKTLGKKIIRWSIPSNNIPLIAVLDNGVYIVLFYRSNRFNMLLFKPIIHYTVVSGSPNITLNWKVKKTMDRRYVYGVADIVYPHIDFKNMNYRGRVKALLPLYIVNGKELLRLIEGFDKYFVER